MKHLLSLLFLSFLAVNTFSQNFELPKNYKFTTDEDYAKYEPDILKSIDWLTNTPIKSEPEKRKEVNAFLIQWLTGCPNISIELNADIINFMKPNSELLIIFMSGWTKYAIETKDYTNKIAGNMKGIEAVIDFYTKNKKDLKKDKNVEKYIKMKANGTLEEFIKKKATI